MSKNNLMNEVELVRDDENSLEFSEKHRLFELTDGTIFSVYNKAKSCFDMFEYEKAEIYEVEEYIEYLEGIPMTRYKRTGANYPCTYVNEIIK